MDCTDRLRENPYNPCHSGGGFVAPEFEVRVEIPVRTA